LGDCYSIDNLGNETVYYGLVTPSTDKTKNYVYNFTEIYHPTDEDWCWCYAEDWYYADSVLGDCDGTPADSCYAYPLAACPEVTFDPADPIVGEEVTITINYTDAVKPVGKVHAYVGPAFKLPDSVLENEVFLEEVADDIYEGEVTFSEAGDRILYLLDGCEDCSVCQYNITVLPAVCPVITIASEVEYPVGSGVMWITEFDNVDVGTGSHEITVAFAAPVVGVRVFVAENTNDWEGGAIIPDDVEEIFMTSTDNMTFTGAPGEDQVGDVFNAGGDDCDEEWIYVLFGEICCPVVCSRTVMIDDSCPEICLIAEVEELNCGTECDWDTGYTVTITSDGVCGYPCEPLACGDNCTDVVGWTITVWDTQPFKTGACDCAEVPCVFPIKECSGTECQVECVVLDCLIEGVDLPKKGSYDYYVLFESEDVLGNACSDWGILTLTVADVKGKTKDVSATLNDAYLDDSSCEVVQDGGCDVMGPCDCCEY